MKKSKSAAGRIFGRIFRKPSPSGGPTTNSTITSKSDQPLPVSPIAAYSTSELNSVPESLPFDSSASMSSAKATTPTTASPTSTRLAPSIVPDYIKPPDAPHSLHTAGSIVKEFAATLRDASDMCLPLKAALVPFVKAWEVYDRTVELQDDFAELASKLTALDLITKAHPTQASSSDTDLYERLDAVTNAVQQLASTISAKQARGRFARTAQSADDVALVKVLFRRVSSLLEVFQFEASIRTESRLHVVLERLAAAEQRHQTRDDSIQRMLAQIERQQEEQKQAREQEIIQETIRLALDKHYVPSASHDAQRSRSGCMPDTRIPVLKRIIDWSQDPRAPPVFYLAGMAGTGKTSIALTICRRLREIGIVLGGSFFCSRSSGVGAQRDARNIIPTLAALLSRELEEVSIALAAELSADRDIPHKQVEVQLHSLLRKPLASVEDSSGPIIFVIDALDECSDELATTELIEVLISFCRSYSGVPVKFMVTSRPETHIRGTPISDETISSVLQLHNIDATQVTEDIHLYIERTLANSSAAEAWYTTEDVGILAQLSGALFIFAATAVAYILGRKDPVGRAGRFRSLVMQVKPSRVATKPLDDMYLLIITQASSPDAVEEQELEETRHLLASLLSTQMPLSVGTLAELLNLPATRLRGSLDRLHAVIHVPEDDNSRTLRPLHASLGDFLFSRAPPNVAIAPALGHDQLSASCLRRMAAKDLCFNVSQSKSSHMPTPAPPSDLALSLQYSCLYWAYHVVAASNSSTFAAQLTRTFRPKFLFWLEVLCVLGEIGRVSGMLLTVASSIDSPQLSQFLLDCNSFVASSRAAIELSAPHIYLSAMPFCPRDSLVYSDFARRCSRAAHIEALGVRRHGGDLLMTLTGHAAFITVVMFSSDGLRLTSGTNDGAAHVWDIRTGRELSHACRGGDAAVQCIALSRDGLLLATGTDEGDLHIWDVEMGEKTMSLPPVDGGHVESIAFSSSTNLLAVGMTDGTLYVYSTDTRELAFDPLIAHFAPVRSLVFSPDDTVLASGGEDCRIQLWNTLTGEPTVGEMQAHEESIQCLAFAPDSLRLASGSADHLIRLWDVQSGQPISSPFRGHQDWVRTISFSPDSRYLASGSDDMTVRVWDVGSGQEICMPLGGNAGYVTSIAFSPDSRSIAAGSRDRVVRIWAVRPSQTNVPQLPGHHGWVQAVAFSPDGRLLASGAHDKSVRIWSVASGQEVVPPLHGHDGIVSSVAFSFDGTHIASGSADGSVRVWNVSTGNSTLEAIRGHEQGISSVVFSADGQSIFSVSLDCKLCICDVATATIVTVGLQCAVEQHITAASVSDCGIVVGALANRTIWVGDARTGAAVAPLVTAYIHFARCIALSSNASRAAVGLDDLSIHIWDSRTGKETSASPLRGHSGSITTLAFSRDGRYLASGGTDWTIRVWDLNDGQEAFPALRTHGGAPNSLAFSPDGQLLVSAADDETVRLWDLEAARSLVSAKDAPNMLALAALRRQQNLNADPKWLTGPEGELLLWIPPEYRNYLQVAPCVKLLARHRVTIDFTPCGLAHGTQWTQCWR